MGCQIRRRFAWRMLTARPSPVMTLLLLSRRAAIAGLLTTCPARLSHRRKVSARLPAVVS
jgi:hypothetical protein